MLVQPTIEKLRLLRLTGMVAALEQQLRTPDIHDLSFEDRLGLLVENEMRDPLQGLAQALDVGDDVAGGDVRRVALVDEARVAPGGNS